MILIWFFLSGLGLWSVEMSRCRDDEHGLFSAFRVPPHTSAASTANCTARVDSRNKFELETMPGESKAFSYRKDVASTSIR